MERHVRRPARHLRAQAVPAVSSDDATPAVGFLRVPLKPGPKKRFTAEQARERNKESRQRHRKRKKEDHAALVASEKKAKEDLAQSRADNVKLAGMLVRAGAEIRRLRGLLAVTC